MPTIIVFQFNKRERMARVSQDGEKKPKLKESKLGNKKSGKAGKCPKGNNENEDDSFQDDFEDFYLQYLKEFATQQFQFEFVKQLIHHKPDPNPHTHIKKAFSLAQQKMVTETIRICGEDIKDEKSFEEILGKGPELFLSDSWKDAYILFGSDE